MHSRQSDVPRSRHTRELLFVWIVTAAALVCVPLALGKIGLSWDALNHHVYLGWTAERNRFDRDYLAASYQAYTFPYLYWPVYKLALGGASGMVAGIVLATIDTFVVPGIWLAARACIPGATWFDAAMRAASVILALSSGLVLSFLDSTANDLVASIPLVWAVALALLAISGETLWVNPLRAVMLSGSLAGVAVAFKLSNGPIAILLPFLWLATPVCPRRRIAICFQASAAGLAAFSLVYGYWGVQLWAHYGNPIYPFYDSWFEPLRSLLGWVP